MWTFGLQTGTDVTQTLHHGGRGTVVEWMCVLQSVTCERTCQYDVSNQLTSD
jgi:hypothetical protein